MDTDRNLLFGVLCLQTELIDAKQFAAVCGEWAARRDGPLALARNSVEVAVRPANNTGTS